MGPWAMPAGCRALDEASGAGSAGGKAGQGKGGGKPGASKPKTSPKQGAKPTRAGQGSGGRGADPSGLLAAVQAFSQVEPFLRSLGLTGKGKGRSSGGAGAGDKQQQRKKQVEPAAEQQRSRQSRRTRDPQPDKLVMLVGTKRQATVVRPDTGEEAAVVAVCATCHWPYWSQRWSHCVNCETRRDEIAKPGPKIWDPKKV